MTTIAQRIKKIPLAIWGLGIATYLLNISSVIVFGLSALYMKNHLGASIATIAAVEGYVEACANFTKVFSGILSDYLRRRRVLMIVGFGLATLARPVLALFPAIEAVLIARIMDRLGNGIQSAPRDALVGDLAPNEIKGTCFGLRQALAQAGSLSGGVLSFIIMTLSENDYILAFWIAAVPAFLGLTILFFLVKEPTPDEIIETVEDEAPHPHPAQQKVTFAETLRHIPKLGRSYFILMGLAGIFFLGRISESFLLLNAHGNFGLPEAEVQFIIMLYNGANSLASFPIGILSDRMKRTNILLAGFAVLIAADLILGFATSIYAMFTAVALWGVQIGVTQSMFLTIIAERVPSTMRGTAIGMFYLITSIALAFGGKFAGYIAENYGISTTFLVSACMAAAAFVGLFALSGKINSNNTKLSRN